MILYLDTSALVKMYAEEAGSRIVRQAVVDARLIATSLLSYAETRSELSRKGRSGEIGTADLKKCRQEFERDWARLHRLPIDETLVRKAGDLCDEHALRALDALHLASAASLQATLGSMVRFACFDNALNRAAVALGLELLRQTHD